MLRLATALHLAAAALVAAGTLHAAPLHAAVQDEGASQDPLGTARDEALENALDRTEPERIVGDADYAFLDGVAIAIDNRIVTWSELIRAFEFNARRLAITTPEQRTALYAELTRDFIRRRLQELGGETLELSEIDLDARLADYIREQRESEGDLLYGERIRSLGRDPLTELPRTRREYLGMLWIDRETGEKNQFGRPKVDTYVRPGVLRHQFPSFVEQSSSDTVELRVLMVLGAAAGGNEMARTVAADMRSQVLAGDLVFAEVAAQLNTEEGNPKGGGLLAPLAVIEIGAGPLRDFVSKAQVGDVSEPQPFGPRGAMVGPLDQIRGYRIFKLESRIAGPPPPRFDDPKTQRFLRDTIRRMEQDRRATTALAAQDARARTWLHPALEELLAGRR